MLDVIGIYFSKKNVLSCFNFLKILFSAHCSSFGMNSIITVPFVFHPDGEPR